MNLEELIVFLRLKKNIVREFNEIEPMAYSKPGTRVFTARMQQRGYFFYVKYETCNGEISVRTFQKSLGGGFMPYETNNPVSELSLCLLGEDLNGS